MHIIGPLALESMVSRPAMWHLDVTWSVVRNYKPRGPRGLFWRFFTRLSTPVVGNQSLHLPALIYSILDSIPTMFSWKLRVFILLSKGDINVNEITFIYFSTHKCIFIETYKFILLLWRLSRATFYSI